MENIEIAVIMTCHNRKEKTIACLKSLFLAQVSFNELNVFLNLGVFLTDDGSSDGTSEAIMEEFPDKNIHIIRGDGQLFWAGGMREAWKASVTERDNWDFFLLLNDDTLLHESCFSSLFKTHHYSIEKFGCVGLYSGITSYIGRPGRISYGGSVWTNKFLAKSRMLQPSGIPQICDMTNANILLAPSELVAQLGFFYEKFHHAIADYDYSIQARKRGIPVFVTGEVCGECDDDHGRPDSIRENICQMSLSARKAYFEHPLHSNRDYCLFIKRNAPFRLPLVVVGRFLNIYFPRLYYHLFQR